MKRKYIWENLVINPGRIKMVPLVITSENLYMKLIWVDILRNSIEYGFNEIQTVACFPKNRFADRNNIHNQFYKQSPVDDFEQIVSYILSHSINHIDRKKEVVA